MLKLGKNDRGDVSELREVISDHKGRNDGALAPCDARTSGPAADPLCIRVGSWAMQNGQRRPKVGPISRPAVTSGQYDQCCYSLRACAHRDHAYTFVQGRGGLEWVPSAALAWIFSVMIGVWSPAPGTWLAIVGASGGGAT